MLRSTLQPNVTMRNRVPKTYATRQARISGVTVESREFALATIKVAGVLCARVTVVTNLGRVVALQSIRVAAICCALRPIITKRRVETTVRCIAQVDGTGVGVITRHILVATRAGRGVAAIHCTNATVVALVGEHAALD